MMKFNDVLRYFLKSTKSKSGDLAEHVGYDISYISKWTSDVKIPSESTAEEVLDRVSEFFTAAVCEKGLVDVVENLSPKRLKLRDEETIFSTIRRFFSDAYSLSLSLHEDYKERGRTKNFTLTGTKNISEFTLEALFKHISASESDVELYATFDIPKLFDINTVNSMNIFITKDIKVTFNTALPASKYSDSFQKNDTISELLLIFKAFDIDINLYGSDKFGDLQALLMEDKFVILYKHLPDGSKIATYTEDPTIISVVQSNVVRLFRESEKLSSKSNDYSFELDFLKRAVNAGESLLIANAFPSGLALTEENVEYIKNNSNISPDKYEVIEKCLRPSEIYGMDYDIDVIYTKSKIDEFTQSKKVNILDEYVFFDAANMKSYVSNIADIIERGENINTYVLKDELPINPDDLTTSIFLTESGSLLKKDKYYVNDNVSLYYAFDKPEVCSSFKSALMELLRTSPYFERSKSYLINYIRGTLIPRLEREEEEEEEKNRTAKKNMSAEM